MLDTFAKRLASQGYPSPGDIDARDRWAIAGRFRPTPWAAGALVAVLGGLAAAFAGTHTSSGDPSLSVENRWRVEHYAYPGDLGVNNRFAIGGSYLPDEEDDSREGLVDATLGAVASSLLGTFTVPGATDGRLTSSLSSLSASLRGSAYVRLLWDLDWVAVPTFEYASMPKRDGQVLSTLGTLTASLPGVVLPPDAVDGRVVIALGALDLSFAGTFTAAPARDGLVSGDLSGLVSGLIGTSVPPQGAIGALTATLGGLQPSLLGTFADWSTDGRVTANLGALTCSLQGQFVAAGANVGRVQGALGELTTSLRGIVNFSLVPPKRVSRAGRRRTTHKVRASKRTTK